jgi:hypothetical protein
MFEHMRPGQKVSIMYYVLYSIRRLVFCWLAFYCSELSFFQIMALMYINLGILMFDGYFKPYHSRFKNRLELLNECGVCIVTIQMCLFTDWVPSKDTQADYGWSMILVITLNTMINMGLVLSVGFKGVFYVTARYILLTVFWIKKFCKGPLRAWVDRVFVKPYQKLKAWINV